MAGTAPRILDPQRKARIVEGAIDVIYEHGLEGLTHRRVAASAGVPLGSTTYYFSSRDELLAAAVEETVRRDLAAIHELLDPLPLDADLAGPLARYACDELLARREASIVAVELFAAALRREQVRAVGVAWDAAWQALLEPRIGRLGALAVSATISGLAQRGLLTGTVLSLEDTTELLRRVMYSST